MGLLLVSVFIISIIAGLIWLFYRRKFTYWSKRKVACQPPTIPFGNFSEVSSGNLTIGQWLGQVYEKTNEPYFGIYSLWSPALVVKDLEIIKHILIGDFDTFRNRPFVNDERADPIAFHSLFGMEAGRWKSMRSKVSPIFTTGKLKLMVPLMMECAADLEAYLKKNSGSVQEMKEVSSKFTTDVITSCAFGISANSFESKNPEFRVAGRRIFDFSFLRSIHMTSYFFAPLLVSLFKLKFIEPVAAGFLKRVFSETTEKRESGEVKPRNDLIDILINLKNEDKSLLDGDALPAQAITFFTAGHETTASAISFTLYELSWNPEIQSRLRKEILQNVQKHGGLTYEGLQEMKYLHMVLSETLRKYPFIGFVGRTASEDYQIPGHDLVIEKGLNIFIPLAGLHFDPRYYPDPEVYNPERFNEDNKKKIPQFAYLPFGDGPRNCIGERFGLISTKLALASIVKEFEVLKDRTTPEKLVFNPRAPLLTSVDGVPIRLVTIK